MSPFVTQPGHRPTFLASSQSANLSMDNLFKGEAIAWNGHFSSHGGADALVRFACADG